MIYGGVGWFMLVTVEGCWGNGEKWSCDEGVEESVCEGG